MNKLTALALGISLALGVSSPAISKPILNITKIGQYVEECGGEESWCWC